MTDLDKYTAVWGKEGLVRFSFDLLAATGIPGDTKKFLHEIGLPLRSEIPLGSCFAPLPVVFAGRELTPKPVFLSSLPGLPCRAIGLIDYDLSSGTALISASTRSRAQSICMTPKTRLSFWSTRACLVS